MLPLWEAQLSVLSIFFFFLLKINHPIITAIIITEYTPNLTPALNMLPINMQLFKHIALINKARYNLSFSISR